MITRWILDSLWNTTTESVKRGVVGVTTDVKILADNVGDLVTKPREKQTQKKRNAHRERYEATVSRVKARQEERQAVDKARKTVDTRDEKRELAFYKERLADFLEVVKSEIAKLNSAYFSFRFRGEINKKCKEKDVIEALLDARTFAEFKLLAVKQLQVLQTIGSKNNSLNQFLKELNENEEAFVATKRHSP